MSSNNIQLTITGRDTGGAAAVTNLTEKERQQVIQSQQLAVQLKQLELAEMRLTAARNQGAAASRNAGRALTEQERAVDRANSTYSRTMSMRHGPGMVLTQTMRQMVRQADGTEHVTAAEMIEKADAVLFSRWQKAQNMRNANNQERENRVRETLARSFQDRTFAGSLILNERQLHAVTRAAEQKKKQTSQGFEQSSHYTDPALALLASGVVLKPRHLELLQQFDPKKAGAAATAMMQPILEAQKKVEQILRETAVKNVGANKHYDDLKKVRSDREQRDAIKEAYWEAERQKYQATNPVGTATAGFVRGGGTFQDDDRFMRRARKAVAKNIAATAELAGKVTAEEFETMSRAMADRMRQRALLPKLGKAWAVARMPVMMAGGAAVGAGMAVQAEREKASQSLVNAAVSQRELTQLAGNQKDLDLLVKTASDLRSSTGMTATEANNAIFSAQSADIPMADVARLTPLLKKTALQPDVAYRLVQKVQSNFGKDSGTVEEIISAAIRASEPAPDKVNDLAQAIGTAAMPFKMIGGTWPELFATVGTSAGPNKNMEATAERMASDYMQLNKKKDQIDWRGQKPLEGRALVLGLNKLLEQGQLFTTGGRVATDLTDFYGEQRAKIDMDTTVEMNRVSEPMLKKILSDKATGHSVLQERAKLELPQANAVMLKDRATESSTKAAEKRWGNAESLLTAAAGFEDAWMIEQGYNWLRRTATWASRGAASVGKGQDFVLDSMMYEGRINDPELVKGYFKNKYRDLDLVGLNKVHDNQTIRYANPNDFTGFESGQRTMTNSEKALHIQAVEELEKAKKPDPAGAPFWPRFTSGPIAEFPGKAKDLLNKFMVPDGVEWGEASRMMHSQAAQAFGVEDDDRKSALLRTLVDKKLSEAKPRFNFAASLGLGAAAREGVLRPALAGLGNDWEEADYKDNQSLIEATIKDLEQKSTTGSDFQKMSAGRKLKALNVLNANALKNDGVMDDAEAADIAKQIRGQDDLAKVMKKLLSPLGRIANVLENRGGGQMVGDTEGQPSAPYAN